MEERIFKRQEVKDLTDIARLQRIERFHMLQIEEYTQTTKDPDFVVGSPRINKDHNMTAREIMEAIAHHEIALREVSNRLAELVIFGDHSE